MQDTSPAQQEQLTPKFTRGRGEALKQWRKQTKASKQLNQHSFPGPHSRSSALARLDLRTAEGLVVKQFRDELIAHVGGNPNVVQRELIERSVWIKLRIMLLDRKIAAGQELTLPDANYYLSWVGHLRRNLTALGITTPKPPADGSNYSAILAELGGTDDQS